MTANGRANEVTSNTFRDSRVVDIQNQVAAEYGMRRETMLFRGKSAGKVEARRAAMIRCRAELGLSTLEIGRAFNMHHTTVLHHLAKADKTWDTVSVTVRHRRHNLTLLEARAMISRMARQMRDQALLIEQQAEQIEKLAQV
jgi:chromosomal replication initiation ATPase DnaA